MELRDFQRVGKLRHASQKCKHFFEGMQAAARTRFRSHTCGLGEVCFPTYTPPENTI